MPLPSYIDSKGHCQIFINSLSGVQRKERLSPVSEKALAIAMAIVGLNNWPMQFFGLFFIKRGPRIIGKLPG
jgi:hypothetical protein